jgi:hypothetical protein
MLQASQAAVSSLNLGFIPYLLGGLVSNVNSEFSKQEGKKGRTKHGFLDD